MKVLKLSFLLLLLPFIQFCSGESKENSEEQTNSKQKPPVQENEKVDKRVRAVEVNNIFSLSQAESFVLIDALLNIEDLDSMQAMIIEIQIEILAIKQNVIEVNSDLKGGEEFKAAVLDQLAFVEKGLKEDIPQMIKVAKSEDLGGRKVADELYFNWVQAYEIKSKIIGKRQEVFVEQHNIRIN